MINDEFSINLIGDDCTARSTNHFSFSIAVSYSCIENIALGGRGVLVALANRTAAHPDLAGVSLVS